MCKFFSCISNGKGRVLFFTLEDIVKEMSSGNKNQYNWNSHTSIADFYGIKGAKEDDWNKWEYDVDNKNLVVDKLNTIDDRDLILKKKENYLVDKDIAFLRNFYNCNSGNWNSGDINSGDNNSGHANSGNWNSGNWNSGDRNSGHFNTDMPSLRMFNKTCKKKIEDIYFPSYLYFNLTSWVSFDTATDEERIKYKADIEVCGGFLKTISYKDAFKRAWDNASLKDKKATLKLPNFNAKIFKEISGIDVKKELKNK